MIVMLEHLTRRAFVAHSASVLSVLAFRRRTSFRRAPVIVRVGVVSQPSSLSQPQRLGLELGLEEARHAASLFGGSLLDVPLHAPRDAEANLSAIIGGGDESSALEWTRQAAAQHTIYMNVGCTADRLREEECSHAAFHVIPSAAMLHDAMVAAGPGDFRRAEAWDASLSRFGADTLNQRFLTRFHLPMTSGAWATWFAVKVLWEAALRQRSGHAAAIADYLLRDATQFDGHKGSPLSFRSWDHQLRQPLYATAGDEQSSRLKEVPAVTGETPVREALDRLGAARRPTACERP